MVGNDMMPINMVNREAICEQLNYIEQGNRIHARATIINYTEKQHNEKEDELKATQTGRILQLTVGVR